MALLTHPAQLSEALGIPFSAQQLAAITAPLEPSVIIAGAGSGKTTVMAARVVWLVGTGQVRPEQVLGLTFTRKAAAELSGRVRAALAGARVVDATGDDDAGEQVIMTYDAFASRLVADHGLRIGVEGDAVGIDLEGEDSTAMIPFAWIVDAKLILTDALMKRGAEERAARIDEEADQDIPE